MERFLDQAESLLQDVVQSRDISTLVVLYRLRDLASVLDRLKLSDECRLTGNCALGLAEALGRRSLEFRQEQADTLALIAGLSVYQPRARTLFIQAVSLCEEVVENDASYSNKLGLLFILYRAGSFSEDHHELGAKWLEQAVQLINEELPSTTMTTIYSLAIYYSYGIHLIALKQYTEAVEAYHKFISICSTLASNDTKNHAFYLVAAMDKLGLSFRHLGKYRNAADVYKAALDLWRIVSVEDIVKYNDQLACMQVDYGLSLLSSGQVSEAAKELKEVVSLYRSLALEDAVYTTFHYHALYRYGLICYLLGQRADAVPAFQESISLSHAVIATDPGQTIHLVESCHHTAVYLHELGKDAEAYPTATLALQMNQWKVLERCLYAPNWSACFVCRRTHVGHSPTTQDATPTSFPASVIISASLLAQSTDRSETSASFTPAEVSATAASAQVPTRAMDLLKVFQPGMTPNTPAHQDSTVSKILRLIGWNREQ